LQYFDTGLVLGQGSFGQVKVFLNKRTKSYVAVKVVRKSLTDVNEEIDQLNEYFVLKHLNHPNIIKVKELFESDSHYYIVMDYIEGCNLAQYLITRQRSEEDTKRIALKIF
jgi:serine/threonine protein kinase